MADKVTELFRLDELTGIRYRVTKEDLAHEAMLKDPRVQSAYEQLHHGLVHPLEYARFVLAVGQEYGL